MNPLLTSIAAFVCVLGGALLGSLLRTMLPQQHLSGDTRDVVRLGTGLIATIAGLVLGLLTAAANSTYETQSGQIKEIAANIVLLDATLAQYGPDANGARGALRPALATLADRIWRENRPQPGTPAAFEASAAAVSLFDEILKLSPRNDAQRWLKARAMDTVNDVAKTRMLLFTRSGGAIPVPFLVVLICWLATIFASFTLFASQNATTMVALCVFAFSAAASIFLILELSQPFTGLMTISDGPLRNALAPMDP
ncbi:MAG: hypothetical protein ACLP8B_13635 [Xanthobacteraceae bacterium]